MDHVSRAVAALRDAETKLKKLASKAIADGDWSSVSVVANWAERLSTMLTETRSLRPQATSERSANQVVKSPAPASGGSDAVETRLKSETPANTTPSSKRAIPGGYPRFHIDNGSLVKVGRSKRGKSEYEHRSPKRVLELLTSKIASLGERKARFATETIVPLHDPDEATEIPTYQVYLCLAWLRSVNLLNQHGRQGYSIAKDGDFPRDVEAAWVATKRNQ